MNGIGVGIRAEIAPRRALGAPMQHHARKRAGGYMNVGIAFVVTQQNVVARLELLDQRTFKNQRLDLGMGHRNFDGADASHQAAHLGGCLIFPEVAGNALLEIARLTDIKHRAALVQHPIDAGQRGEMLEKNPGVERQWWRYGHLGDIAARSLGHLTQNDRARSGIIPPDIVFLHQTVQRHA